MAIVICVQITQLVQAGLHSQHLIALVPLLQGLILRLVRFQGRAGQGRAYLALNFAGGVRGLGALFRQLRESRPADFQGAFHNGAALPLHQPGLQLKNFTAAHRLQVGEPGIRLQLILKARSAENDVGVGHAQGVVIKLSAHNIFKHIGYARIGHNGAAQHVPGHGAAAQVIEIAGRDHRIVGHHPGDLIQGQKDILGGGNARVVTGTAAGKSGRNLGEQALIAAAVRSRGDVQHRQPRIPQGFLRRGAGRVQQHQVRVYGGNRLGVRGIHLLQVPQAFLGALRAARHQLGFQIQRQHHIGQAGRKHRHPLGFGGNGHTVYVHWKLPGRHAGGQVRQSGAGGKAAAQQDQNQHKDGGSLETH